MATKSLARLSLAVLVLLNGLHLNSDAFKRCLEDLSVVFKQPRSFKQEKKELPLTVAYSRRRSHQVSSHLIKILLEEGLGYSNVELKEIPQSSVNSRVTCTQHALINTEVWIPFSDSAHERCQDMVDVGPLGITGRSSWFNSKKVINSEWTDHHIPLDHWRSLQLPAVGQQFLNASTVVHVNTTCNGCINHVFYPPQCDPVASGNASSCILLIAGVKDEGIWGDVLEQQIAALALNVSVAWLGSHLHSKVTDEEAKSRPVLFHSWEPDPLSMSEKFVRIAFPECRSPWYSSSVSFVNQSTGCESPVYELHKFAAKEIKESYADIYHLLQLFYLTKESLAEMFHDYNQSDNQVIETTVCNWLRKSRDVWLPWLPAYAHNKRTVFIGGMFPNLAGSEAVWTSPGDEVGAQMAVDHVNANKKILTSYQLKLFSTSTQCRRDLVFQAYVHYLNREPAERVIGILGPACSKATMPVAQVSSLRNTIMMGYAADDVSLSNRTKFPLYFRTVPTIDDFKFVYLSLFEELRWAQCAALRETKYPEKTVRSRTNFLTKNGIKVLSRELSTVNGLDPTSYVRALKESKMTVILLDTYPTTTRAIMCEAYKQGLTARHGYVWFLLGWLDQNWWDTDSFNDPQYAAPENVPCDSEEMHNMVEQGYFSLSPSYYGHEKQEIISGSTVRQWKEEYQRKTKEENKTASDYATLAYDAVWAYAFALDKLTKSYPQGLDTMNSRNTTMMLRDYIQKTHFWGASGHVHFRSADRQSSILVKQNFATYSVEIGEFVPIINSSNSVRGKLKLNLPLIKWATGHIARDSLEDPSNKKQCGAETLRKALDLTCAEATAVAIVIGVTLVVLLLAIVIFVLKRRYSSKYKTTKNRLRELGLLNGSRSTHIFALDEWEIPADKILLNRKLGEGAFGAVFGGEALGVMEEEKPIPVAVKALRTGSTVEEKVEFLSEADKMKQFSHDNIVQLLAVCTVGEPVYIVMELMIHGDLKSFLLARRRVMNQPGSPEADEVVPRRLTAMAMDIARGLQYLAKNKFVHRDLALRNCMVGFGNVVKIGDFGLSRPLIGSDYYRYEKKGMFPVRWMSPESLREGMFTRYTDVWSYGVTLWELLTFGGFPYQGLSNAEVLERVCGGETISVPPQCTFEAASLLRMCWSWDPLDRPSAARIVQILSESPEIMHACVGVPATTVDDDSTGKFDATRVRKITGALHS